MRVHVPRYIVREMGVLDVSDLCAKYPAYRREIEYLERAKVWLQQFDDVPSFDEAVSVAVIWEKERRRR